MIAATWVAEVAASHESSIPFGSRHEMGLGLVVEAGMRIKLFKCCSCFVDCGAGFFSHFIKV